MNRDDSIRMAREAGLVKPWMTEIAESEAQAIERFAALVAEHVFAGNFQHLIDLAARKERIACAKVCEAQADQWDKRNLLGYVGVLEDAAAAIRARGQA